MTYFEFAALFFPITDHIKTSLFFEVGDAIEVLQKKDDGWWKGRVQGLDWTGNDHGHLH